MNDVSQRVEKQLSHFEEVAREANSRIQRIEHSLNSKLIFARKLLLLMKSHKNPMILYQIVDVLEDIQRISDKLMGIDITPSGYQETSLESLTEQEYDEMEELII